MSKASKDQRGAFRKAVLAGKQLVGTFAAIPSPVAMDILSASGLDFICIDTEHGPIGRETLENMIRAADVHAIPAMARVQNLSAEHIQNALDGGAVGVLVPRVSTVAEARDAVRFSRYPPAGVRGAGPGRASGYGYRIVETVDKANDTILVAVQVETREGLGNVAAISAVDGIDMILVGPGDLAVSLEALGSARAGRLDAAIVAIIEAGRAAGRPVGIFCNRAADVEKWKARGVTVFIVGSDAAMLSTAASDLAALNKG